MTRPAIAYACAARRRTLLNDTSASEQSWEDEHSNDPRWSAAVRLAARRSQELQHGTEETQQALASLWVERVNTGYMAIALHPLAGEFALVADSGLQELINLAAVYVARHYRGSSFDAAHCPPVARSSFGRLYQIQLGQFYLYGRFCEPSPAGLDGGAVAERVMQEATLFALAHELGHAVAATEHRAGHMYWLDEQQAPANLGHVAVEIEADAFAVALCFADLWGASVGEAEATLRMLAIRLTLNAMEAVEAASLVPRVDRHLPARRRWNGIRSYLAERFPAWLLERVDELWEALAGPFTFTEASVLVPPFEGVLFSLARDGWLDAYDPAEEEQWAQREQLVWHFRLPLRISEYLIGADAVSTVPGSEPDHVETFRAGQQAVTELLEGLPDWLVGDDPAHGQATSGELISYLRIRERWPAPFCDGAPLPIHLMASAVHQRLNGRFPRSPEARR